MAIALTTCDATMVLILMYLIYWLKNKEYDDVERQDQKRVTAADFTIRIMSLPSSYKDVEIFSKELRKHFEKTVIIKGEKDKDTGKMSEDKNARVIDINFGFDDQSVLRARRKRGQVKKKKLQLKNKQCEHNQYISSLFLFVLELYRLLSFHPSFFFLFLLIVYTFPLPIFLPSLPMYGMKYTLRLLVNWIWP